MRKLIWTPIAIKEGFERLLRESGRLPTAPEVDSAVYLPSSRFIQQKYGGLEKLRAECGYAETHNLHLFPITTPHDPDDNIFKF